MDDFGNAKVGPAIWLIVGVEGGNVQSARAGRGESSVANRIANTRATSSEGLELPCGGELAAAGECSARGDRVERDAGTTADWWGRAHRGWRGLAAGRDVGVHCPQWTDEPSRSPKCAPVRLFTGHSWESSNNEPRILLPSLPGEFDMSSPESDADDALYNVVINHEEQYSIWRADKALPSGWKAMGNPRLKADCLAHIEEVWTDMRPRSLRDQMD